MNEGNEATKLEEDLLEWANSSQCHGESAPPVFGTLLQCSWLQPEH